MQSLCCLCFSALGFLWGNGIYGHILIPLVVIAWLFAPDRATAWGLMLAYYLAAARGVPFGYRIYETLNPGDISGFLLWFIACLALSLPWLALWKYYKERSSQETLVRLLIVLLLISVPPVGIVGWGNPLIYGAGWYFPRSGFIGVLFTMIMFVALHSIASAGTDLQNHKMVRRYSALIAIMLLLVSAGLNVAETTENHRGSESAAKDWMGINTEIGGIEGAYGFEELNSCLDLIIYKATTGQRAFVLAPEFASFRWDDMTNMTLRLMEKQLSPLGVTVIINAQGKGENSGSFDNEMRAYGRHSGFVYRQRFPPPVGMWRPWTKGWTRAHWFDTGIWHYQDAVGQPRRAACLICYEQLIVMPVAVSMLFQPDIIIAQENHWWSKNTPIPNCAREAIMMIGRLFGVPVVTARNT